MASVQTEVVCPRCGGEATEDFHCSTYQAWYHCKSCGYHTWQGEGEGEALTLEKVPQELRPFAEWVEVHPDHGWVYQGEVLMAPCQAILVSCFSVIPVNRDSQLVWLLYRVEEIPPEEQPNYPHPGEGYYEYRQVDTPEHFTSFSEAWESGAGGVGGEESATFSKAGEMGLGGFGSEEEADACH